MPTSMLDVEGGFCLMFPYGTYAVALTTRHPSPIICKFTDSLLAGTFPVRV